MKTFLKVKIKSLAAEAQIIRKEEAKAKSYYHFLKDKQGKEDKYEETKSLFWWLRQHRTYDVRMEARATQWAYAFLRNKPFSFVEKNTNPYGTYGSLCSSLNPIISKAAKMVQKYHDKKVDITDIRKWVENTNSITEKKKNAA